MFWTKLDLAYSEPSFLYPDRLTQPWFLKGWVVKVFSQLHELRNILSDLLWPRTECLQYFRTPVSLSHGLLGSEQPVYLTSHLPRALCHVYQTGETCRGTKSYLPYSTKYRLYKFCLGFELFGSDTYLYMRVSFPNITAFLTSIWDCLVIPLIVLLGGRCPFNSQRLVKLFLKFVYFYFLLVHFNSI